MLGMGGGQGALSREVPFPTWCRAGFLGEECLTLGDTLLEMESVSTKAGVVGGGLGSLQSRVCGGMCVGIVCWKGPSQGPLNARLRSLTWAGRQGDT